jgi:hypothetical protein
MFGFTKMLIAVLLSVGFVVAVPVVASSESFHGSTAVAAADPSCADGSYTLERWRLRKNFEWYYNPAGAPANVAGSAVSAIQAGTQSMFSGKNPCGISVALPVRQVYQGLTALSPQIPSDKNCSRPDGNSVIGWGVFSDPRTVAHNCTYYNSRGVKESDTLLNVRSKWFTGNLPAGCTDRFHLESVVTHERGHTIGLNHPAAPVSLLTMSSKTHPCTTYKATLARGDALGLAVIARR